MEPSMQAAHPPGVSGNNTSPHQDEDEAENYHPPPPHPQDHSYYDGPKGKRHIAVGGYKFLHSRTVENKDGTVVHYYRCANRKTKCNVKANFRDGDLKLPVFNYHNHPAETAKRKAEELLSNMRKKVKTDLKTPIRQVYDQERAAINQTEDRAALGALTSWEACSSILKRQRRTMLPAAPKTLADIALSDSLSQYLMFDEGVEERIMVFGSDYNFRALCGSERIHLDGTFKCAPVLFVQLFTIHALVGNMVVPLLYCLLPSKKGAVYQRLFLWIRKHCEELNLQFLPSVAITDFEAAIVRAIRQVFGHIVVKGCFFHYAQAIKKKVTALGLNRLWKRDDVIKQLVKRLRYMAFLPVEEIPDTADAVETEAHNAIDHLKTNDIEKVTELFEYYKKTWVTGCYNLERWCVWSSDTRTNNLVESFNSTVSKHIRKNPSVFELVWYINNRINTYHCDMQWPGDGEQNKSKATPRKQYREREQKIDQQKELYRSGAIDQLAYIDAIAQLYKRKNKSKKRQNQQEAVVGTVNSREDENSETDESSTGEVSDVGELQD